MIMHHGTVLYKDNKWTNYENVVLTVPEDRKTSDYPCRKNWQLYVVRDTCQLNFILIEHKIHPKCTILKHQNMIVTLQSMCEWTKFKVLQFKTIPLKRSLRFSVHTVRFNFSFFTTQKGQIQMSMIKTILHNKTIMLP